MITQDNIAVVVNKNDKIWPGHFGIAPYYNIYDKEKKLIEKRLNPLVSEFQIMGTIMMIINPNL